MLEQSDNDLAVLREMVRLAESRRKEELEHIERVNRYNLALIAFTGSFLSLLVSTKFPLVIVKIAGGLLLFSITFSLIAILPRKVKGGSLVIEDDVDTLRSGNHLHLDEYLLVTADLTDKAAAKISALSQTKKLLTLFSALFLAFSLAATYYMYVYA